MLTVQAIQEMFMDLYKRQDYQSDGTLELTGVSFRANLPTIFGLRNFKYIDAEMKWYESQSRNVNRLFEIYGKEVKIWKDVANDNNMINSNYGWCIYSDENDQQYNNVYNELNTNKQSRRAIMVYTRPSMHYDWGFEGMNDFMCTTSVQYLIRNGYLNAIVNMRSNDAVFGYNNDYVWQDRVLRRLAWDLDVPLGHITWQVGSLHVYPRHRHLVKEMLDVQAQQEDY